MNRYFKAEIAENIRLNKDYNLLTFIPLNSSPEPEPGQFYMIGRCRVETEVPSRTPFCKDIYDPLLKRPFSLFRKTRKGLQILFRIKGKGTIMMKDMKKGTMINILGPLGNSYPMPPKNKTPLIIAGGIGIASLFSLAERLEKSRNKAYIYYGVQTERELLMRDELKKFAKELSVSTDDGSCGERGCITDIAEVFLSNNPSLVAGSLIYACGPRKMLETIARISKSKGIEAYISMEENMACGIGACLGCSVKTINGYKRICKEGPVFNVKEIVW